MPYCLHYPSWLLEHPAEEGRGRKRKEEEKGQKKKQWEGWGGEERRDKKERSKWERISEGMGRKRQNKRRYT